MTLSIGLGHYLNTDLTHRRLSYKTNVRQFAKPFVKTGCVVFVVRSLSRDEKWEGDQPVRGLVTALFSCLD